MAMSMVSGFTLWMLIFTARLMPPPVELPKNAHKDRISLLDVRRMAAHPTKTPLKLSGVVVHIDPDRKSFAISDHQSCLTLHTSQPVMTLVRGHEVSVVAQWDDSRPGVLVAKKMSVEGLSPLPEPIIYDLNPAEARWYDSQYVTINADILQIKRCPQQNFLLNVASTKNSGTVILPKTSSKKVIESLKGKTVKITGLCKIVGGKPEIHVTTIEQVQNLPRWNHGQSSTWLTIGELRDYIASPFPTNRRVRVEGTIVGRWRNQIFLEDQGSGVSVIVTNASEELAVGRYVRVVGILHRNSLDGVCELHDPNFVNLRPVVLPEPIPVTGDILARGINHAQRVRVTGEIIRYEPSFFGQPSLTIEVNDVRTVLLLPENYTKPSGFEPGAVIQVSGTAIKNGPWANMDCAVLVDNAASLKLLEPAPQPPYWTSTRYFGLGVVLCLLMSGSAAWIFLLRNALARQKKLLKIKAQREIELANKLRQSQKLEAIGRLAGGIAHDFNNMLTVINGSAEILPELIDDEPDCARQLISDIGMAGKKAAGLVAQLLMFSRQRTTQLSPIRLNDVVVECEKMLRRVMVEDVKIFTILGNDMPSIMGEPILLHQVIVNLAVNARDAMPQGGTVTIATRVVTKSDGQKLVRLSVADSGCGMTPEVKDKIFEPFFTTKDVGQGTGLGLSTVYGIVQTLNGTINIESEVGVGTTFDLDFPIAPESVISPGSDVKTPTRLLKIKSSRRILLVEDDDAVRELTTRLLEKDGYRVDVADTPSLAIEYLERSKYDLLITDVVMPGMGGRELADRALEFQPTLRVLFVSGYTADEVLRHGVQEDDVDFLNKPFTTVELSEKVLKILTRSGRKGYGSSRNISVYAATR